MAPERDEPWNLDYFPGAETDPPRQVGPRLPAAHAGPPRLDLGPAPPPSPEWAWSTGSGRQTTMRRPRPGVTGETRGRELEAELGGGAVPSLPRIGAPSVGGRVLIETVRRGRWDRAAYPRCAPGLSGGARPARRRGRV